MRMKRGKTRMERFKGVIPVIPTPFNRDGDFDGKAKEELRRVVEFVIEAGVDGVIPAAGSGEFFLLSESERKQVFDITIDQARGRIPVIPNASAASTREAIMYSQYAEKVGADGVMVVAPYYSMPSEEEIFRFFSHVGQAISIPIMVYNDPFPTGVDISPKLLARLSNITNINSVKESSMDLTRVQSIKRLCGEKMTYFFGNDHPSLDAFLLGAEGWVPSAYFAPLAVELYKNMVEQKDMHKAHETYSKLLELLEPESEGELSNPSSYVSLQKTAFELMGMSVGPPRGPLSPLTDDAKNALRKKLTRAGMIAK
jgi:4-hydroxy-tetrahydrodipicolinate synthase